MHVCVVGGGIAGSLLAWRLSQQAGTTVELIIGEHGGLDATEVSGGGVRGYETDPAQRRLALASLIELMGSKVLRDWADYRRTGSVYLRWPDSALDSAVSEVDDAIFGSAQVMPAGKLGWVGLPEGTVAVLERCAGYISPSRLRAAVLTELAKRAVITKGNAGQLSESADKVIVAAGAWTPELLRRNGYGADEYSTKSIQYAIYRTGNWRPPVFVDEISGLYGRPTTDGMLLGLPTQDWGAVPGFVVPSKDLEKRAAELAATRFPELRLGSLQARVRGTDCYTGHPVLQLRTVTGSDRLHTFTGGSGGSVKTALAASQIAARAITGG